MKTALFIFFLSSSLWAKPVILVSYFDAFGRAPFNNSEVVALALYESLKDHPDFELKLCKVRTVFDKSFYELEDCIRSLPEAPHMVLSLGESNCNLKIEAMGRNVDYNVGPDNDGVVRNYSSIIKDGPKATGFTYPLPDMYCALSEVERNRVQVSNNAGTFVCNNLSYQVANKLPELNFGFIHVPANSCKDLSEKTSFSIKALEVMIKKAALITDVSVLPVKKKELKELRRLHEGTCKGEYFKKLKGIDEKKIWPF